jgi:hypothetical protein
LESHGGVITPLLPARQTEDECRGDQSQTGTASSIKRQPRRFTRLRLRPGRVETSGSCVRQDTANPIKEPAQELYSQVPQFLPAPFSATRIPVSARTSQAWPRRFNSAFASRSFWTIKGCKHCSDAVPKAFGTEQKTSQHRGNPPFCRCGSAATAAVL